MRQKVKHQLLALSAYVNNHTVTEMASNGLSSLVQTTSETTEMLLLGTLSNWYRVELFQGLRWLDDGCMGPCLSNFLGEEPPASYKPPAAITQYHAYLAVETRFVSIGIGTREIDCERPETFF